MAAISRRLGHDMPPLKISQLDAQRTPQEADCAQGGTRVLVDSTLRFARVRVELSRQNYLHIHNS